MIIIFVCLEKAKEEKEKIQFPVIIGASCGGAFVISLISICLIRYCQEKKKLRQCPDEDGMPAESMFPNPEKYELQEAESKQDLARFEKSYFPNVATRCQEVGNTNDAADYQ